MDLDTFSLPSMAELATPALMKKLEELGAFKFKHAPGDSPESWVSYVTTDEAKQVTDDWPAWDKPYVFSCVSVFGAPKRGNRNYGGALFCEKWAYRVVEDSKGKYLVNPTVLTWQQGVEYLVRCLKAAIAEEPEED